MAMWKNGGTLPRDQKKLSRIARGAISEAVLAFFDTDEEGIYQKRLRAELECAQKKSIAATQSAKIRWADKPLKTQCQGNPIIVIVIVRKEYFVLLRSAQAGNPSPPR
jgi:uncharacterized protein YdaU (DUF1376 family)